MGYQHPREVLKKRWEIIDTVSKSFCSAKWFQTTLYLQTGWNHSCHHPAPHKIPLEEVEQNYKALHNTKFKKQQMQMMLDGERPPECDYCWRVEDLGGDNVSDRYYKSSMHWAWDNMPKIIEKKTEDINPTYLEISFSNVCNFKCAYCTPDVSSKWLEEIQQHGPYPTSWKTGDLIYLKQTDRYPYANKDYNPYVEAFWKWWPELYSSLNTLRLTGGEPLLSKDVWSILEKIEENPNPNLILAVNTNLNIPDNLVEKFIQYVERVAPKLKEIQIYTSCEATGRQAEYIRYGMNYVQWYDNLDNFIQRLPANAFIGIMTTINIMSLSTLDVFVEDILSFRKKYYKSFTNNNVILSINYLRWPPYLHMCLAPNELKEKVAKKLDNLIEKHKDEKKEHFGMLFHDDVDKLSMIANLLRTHNIPETDLLRDRKDFVSFITEYDKRKNLNFAQTFPELKTIYEEWKTL